MFHAAVIALMPRGRGQRSQPGRGDGRAHVEGRPHGCSEQLQTAQYAEGSPHMGRVCPVRAAGFAEPERRAFLEQLLSQDPCGVAGEKTRPKRAENGEVKARVSHF